MGGPIQAGYDIVNPNRVAEPFKADEIRSERYRGKSEKLDHLKEQGVIDKLTEAHKYGIGVTCFRGENGDLTFRIADKDRGIREYTSGATREEALKNLVKKLNTILKAQPDYIPETTNRI